MLEVVAFGAVRAVLDGVPVDLGGPRQRAVLGRLVAAGGRTVSSDRMLDELWAGQPPPTASGSLQVYISRLRSALEPDRVKRRPAAVLVSVPPGYAIDLPAEAVDTWQFASLVRSARELAGSDADERVVGILDAALTGWRDEPFAEHTDQDWAAAEAAALIELRSEAVELRAAAAIRLGRGRDTVADLERHVRQHPLREQAVGLLARGLYVAGRQADALGVLAQLRERLVDELGVDPRPETRALEQDILQQAEHLDPGPGRAEAGRSAYEPAPPEPGRSHPVAADPVSDAAEVDLPTADVMLAGREDELTRLEAAAVAARRRPGVVWVEGDAGFGKSALVDRFADASVGTWVVVRGHCSEVTGAPPGYAWREVLRDLDGGRDLAMGADLDAFAVADAIQGRLAARARPVLVVLENVHRADDATFQVLRHLLDGNQGGVLMVATFRSHEVTRDLSSTLALVTEHTLDRIALRGLPDRESRILLDRFVPHALPEPVWRILCDRAAGNPLFLRQLGQLVAAEGRQAAETLPEAIRDLLNRRIDRLPPSTADTLARAAVLGLDIDLDLVLAVEQELGSPVDEDILVDRLDAGVVAGLLDLPRPGEIRFIHALVRDTFYSRLPPLRRHRLHRAAVTMLEREHPDRLDALAFHAAAGLDRRSASSALGHLLAAAEHSGDRAAVGHLRTALQAAQLAGVPAAKRLPIRSDLVGALARDGDASGAQAERRVAVLEAERHGTALDVARAWQWRAPMMWSRRDVSVPNQDVLTHMWHLLDEIGRADLAVRADLLVALATEADPWDMDAQVAAATEAVLVAEETGDPELICRALNVVHFGALKSRDVGALEDVAERLQEVATAHGLHGYQALAEMMLQSAAVGRADLGTAADHVAAAIHAGTSGQLPELLQVGVIFEGTVHLLQGDLDAARTTFGEVCRQIRAAGDPNADSIELWVRTAVEFAAGDVSPLRADAERIGTLIPQEANDILVCALADASDLDAARTRWGVHPLEHGPTWLFNAALRAHLVSALGDPGIGTQLYDELLPWSGQLARTLNGALALGPVDHFLGLLAEVRGDREVAARHFAAAQQLTGPAMAPVWNRSWIRTPDKLRQS